MTKRIGVPNLVLNDGYEVPQFGLGVFLLPPNETQAIVSEALEAGYRHIDTAAMYRNEAEIGRAIAGSGVERSELFIATKVKNADQGFDSVQRAIDESLNELQLDYLDLYLMHWPAPRLGLFVETWLGMEAAVATGKIRTIGVCNFLPEHLDELLAKGSIVPAVNQIELHPAFQQPELRAYHSSQGILTEAWGPLGQNKYQLSSLPGLTEIAERHGKSIHQVTLRWHLQLGNIVFPKTRSTARLRENLDVFDFELTGLEMLHISKFDVAFRLGNNPHFRA